MGTSFQNSYGGYYEPFTISEFKTCDYVVILNMQPRAGIGFLRTWGNNGEHNLSVIQDTANRQFEVHSFILNGNGKGFITAYDADLKEYFLLKNIYLYGNHFEMTVWQVSRVRQNVGDNFLWKSNISKIITDDSGELLAYSMGSLTSVVTPSFAFREAKSSSEDICLVMHHKSASTTITDYDEEYRNLSVSSNSWFDEIVDALTALALTPVQYENSAGLPAGLEEARINNPCMIEVTNQYENQTTDYGVSESTFEDSTYGTLCPDNHTPGSWNHRILIDSVSVGG